MSFKVNAANHLAARHYAYPSQTIQSSHLEGDGGGDVNSTISMVMYDLAETRPFYCRGSSLEGTVCDVYLCLKRCIYVKLIHAVITAFGEARELYLISPMWTVSCFNVKNKEKCNETL